MYNKVLDVTMTVDYPTTVTGYTVEWWCEHMLIPSMIQEGLEYAILDNARPHRRVLLRILFALHGLAVYFLPPYSPWLQPIEKIFLCVHMKCNQDVEHTRASFTESVLECMRRMTAEEVEGCWGASGWT